jgi:hypothetical protein
MKGLSRVVTLAVVILLAGLVAVLFKKRIERLMRNIKDAKAKRKEQQLLDDLGIELTHSPEYYNSLANELHQAVYHSWYDWNCDETATQRVLMKLNTDRDYNELAIKFGVRDTYNMETYIQACLNQTEKNLVNQTWSGRGMTKRI